MARGPAIRVAVVIGALLILGIAIRLLGNILKPVLPDALMRDLEAGWAMLYSIISPAMAAIFAAAILGALIWAVAGWLRRR